MIVKPDVAKGPLLRGCTNKVPYATAEAAMEQVRFQTHTGKAGNGRGGHLGAYQCNYCHQWHVGHHDPRRSKGRSER